MPVARYIWGYRTTMRPKVRHVLDEDSHPGPVLRLLHTGTIEDNRADQGDSPTLIDPRRNGQTPQGERAIR